MWVEIQNHISLGVQRSVLKNFVSFLYMKQIH